MPKYMTKQRKALLSFLSAHADEELSARQIAQTLSGEGISISAVYRNLSALEQEGKIRRVSKNGKPRGVLSVHRLHCLQELPASFV